MTSNDDGVRRVERALEAAVGERAPDLLHRASRHLANLTPHEVAQQPGGARIVLAELDNIVREAELNLPADIEPRSPLEEVLDGETTKAVMEADGVTRQEVDTLMEDAKGKQSKE